MKASGVRLRVSYANDATLVLRSGMRPHVALAAFRFIYAALCSFKYLGGCVAHMLRAIANHWHYSPFSQAVSRVADISLRTASDFPNIQAGNGRYLRAPNVMQRFDPCLL